MYYLKVSEPLPSKNVRIRITIPSTMTLKQNLVSFKATLITFMAGQR